MSRVWTPDPYQAIIPVETDLFLKITASIHILPNKNSIKGNSVFWNFKQSKFGGSIFLFIQVTTRAKSA